MSMILHSPALPEGRAVASDELIRKVIGKLWKYKTPLVVLEKNESEFVQSIWVREGYVVEFQQGSWKRHFRSQRELNDEETLAVLLSYLHDKDEWMHDYPFCRFDPRPWPVRLLYSIGYVFGRASQALRH